MKYWSKRAIAFFAAALVTLSLVRYDGAAALKGVYFTAVNDQLLALSSETMPFWVDNTLYVCSYAFDGTDLGVRYVRNYSMGLAVLYTSQKDLRFDLVNQTTYDKDGEMFTGAAIEKNNYIFFPIDLVCRYFGLKWSLNSTATVPLVRIKNADAVLDDRSFINAAATMMASRYAEYEKQVNSSQEETPPEPTPGPDIPPERDPAVVLPPIHAEAGQKVYLILSGSTESSLRDMMDLLDGTPATFLLTVQQMENGDLLRALLGSGHGVTLLLQSKTEDEISSELLRARELVWTASCSLLQSVWYEGHLDLTDLLEEQGCVIVSASIDRRSTALRTDNSVETLMRTVGQYSEDVSIYLGNGDNCADGLEKLLQRLSEAQYRLCAWRLTA